QVQKHLKHVWDVLATVTHSEYINFRDKLGQASGFQSYGNRVIDFMLCDKKTYIMMIYEKDQEMKERLDQIYNDPSIYDATIQAVARAGFSIDKAILNRDVSQTHQSNESVKAAWMNIYQDVDQYWELYELAEKLVDVEDLFQQWRFR